MQPRKKKPFIDKKNSVTFHLVHRSQKDPLAADETAPQHVLLEAQPLNKNKVRCNLSLKGFPDIHISFPLLAAH